MKSKSSTPMVESETERGPPTAYEVLMPRPRTSKSPKKHESPRPPPEDDVQRKIAKENRAANKKNLEIMSKNINEKHSNSKHSSVDNMAKMPKIVFLPSDSEEEKIDLERALTEKPSKRTANSAKRKILSDSESDVQDSPKKNYTKADSPLQLQQSRLNFKPQSNASSEEVNTKKRNSLLNYFNSVSKEEAKKTAEQIKVKVHIHSPPTTPGRKPINQKSPPIESPRRSARMRLSYEMCEQIEVISSEIISASNTPVKISLKKTEVPKVETPKRSSPRKSPLKIKEKPEYVKNLKLKLKAPVKLTGTAGAPAEKFILSPEALDELFLSPNPNKKGDKELKKHKKKKKVNLAECDDDASKSTKKVNKMPKLTPEKTNTTNLKATPKKVIVTPKNSPRTKAASALKSKSSSKTTGRTPSKHERSSVSSASSAVSADAMNVKASPSLKKKVLTPNKSHKKSNISDSIVTPKKSTVTTPKSLPRSKTTKTSATKSVTSTSKPIGKMTPSKLEKSSGKHNLSLKTSGKSASKRERSSESDGTATKKSVAKTESPARRPRKPSVGTKSPQVIKEIPLVKIATPSKSGKSPKSVSNKNNETLMAGKSAFEEIMSKKKSHVSKRKVKDVATSSVPEIKKSKKSSSTLAKNESLKLDRSILNSTTNKVSETKQESNIQSPSKGIRKSSRIPSSESRKARYCEEIEEPVKQQPKKRKRKIESDDSEDDDDVVWIEPKNKKHQSQSTKPPLKLAPMFMKRSSSKITEKIEDPAVTEAKRRFLSSGVPECIKKIAEIFSQPEQEVLIFPTIAHVKQEDEFPAWTLSERHLELLPEDNASFVVKSPMISPGTLMEPKSAAFSDLREPKPPRRIDTYRKVLNNLKLENPNYCVIRNYKRLKSKYLKSLPQPVAEKTIEVKAKRPKRGRKPKRSDVEVIEEPTVAQEPCLVWTEKYKPMSSEDVVGNVVEVTQLKAWLESWKRFHKSDDPNYDIIKRKRSKSGSSEEFIDNDESGGEEDNSQMPINTSLVFGPCGSGKTSTVYAIAHELGYKVLEINASSKRTGKHLLKLQEATQSHRLCAKNEAAESIAKMFSQPAKQKKKNTAKVLPKPVESDEASNKMSLILIENADIIFEDEDEGFVAALITLVQSSKRPVVIVANDSLCPHLSRFVEQSLVIDLDWPHPSHLSVWLQLVSLIEGVRISAAAAQRLVGRFNGDVARCLNQLQFWTMTGGNNLENCVESLTSSMKDEDSSDSMAITEKIEEGTPLHDRCIELFLGNTSRGLIPYPVSLSEVWWNLAPVLSLPQPKSRRIAVEPYLKPHNATERLNELFSEVDGAVEEENIFDRLKRKNRSVDTDVILEEEIIKPVAKKTDVVAEKWVSVCSQDEVDALAMLMDNLAAADEMTSNPETNGGTYDVGPCTRVWDRKPADGISGRLDFSLCWHRERDVAQSVAHFLVDRSVDVCRDKLGKEGGEYDVSLPKREDIRWLLEQQEADNTIVSLVPSHVLVDHRATFVDYLPTLQSICRHENARLSTNTKRRNRFFHYLRGLGCHPSEEAVNVLCSTFDTGLWRCEDRGDSDKS